MCEGRNCHTNSDFDPPDKGAYSQRLLEAAIEMVAINSLLEVDENPCLELNAADLILEKGKGRRYYSIMVWVPFKAQIWSLPPLRCVSEGFDFRQIRGARRLTMMR